MSLHVPGTEARDYSPLLDLTPTSVGTFLRVSGWDLDSETRDASSVWISPNRGESLFLPLDPTYSDFSRRFEEALRTISSVHGVHGEALALEIASARNDILLLRADQITRYGTIPLAEAQQLLDGARKMLTAAACSTVRPRASTKGRKPAAVTDFIADDVRMGHTLRGSFVLTIYADLDAIEEPQRSGPEAHLTQAGPDDHLDNEGPEDQALRERSPQAADDVVPFARRVFSTLASGLVTAQEMLEGAPVDLTAAINSGVSAELLESLHEMSRPEGLRALDMAFRWSASEPLKESGLPQRVIVNRDQAQSVEPHVKRLRLREEAAPKSVLGYVRKLERDADDEEGVAIVEGTLDTEKGQRSVRVPLAGAQYRQAIRAHESRQPIVVSGVIERRGRSWTTQGRVTISEVAKSLSADDVQAT